MIIIDLSVIFPGSPGPASCSLYRYRICIFYPIGNINVVYMLFYDMISAKPVKIIPVSHLVIHLGLSGSTWFYPYSATVPIYLAGHNITHSTFFHPFQHFPVIGLVTALQAYNHI
ncbi:hypothetical protein D9M68_769060 [compost metagenome]